jgi:predicted nucleic acid-binding protein
METAYIETTIIGNIAGRLHKDPNVSGQQLLTRDWWIKAAGKLDLYISQLVLDECSGGDPTAAAECMAVVNVIRLLDIIPECHALAGQLLAAKAVPQTEPRDALHIAIASVHQVNYLLTWNFKHIANAGMRHQIETVIRSAGYDPPVICTPQELLLEDKP